MIVTDKINLYGVDVKIEKDDILLEVNKAVVNVSLTQGSHELYPSSKGEPNWSKYLHTKIKIKVDPYRQPKIPANIRADSYDVSFCHKETQYKYDKVYLLNIERFNGDIVSIELGKEDLPDGAEHWPSSFAKRVLGIEEKECK